MELNTISNTGSWGNSANRLNENFSKVNTEVEKLKNATTKNKGYFKTDALLKQAHPTANNGDLAYVGTSYPYQIWTWNGTNWEDSQSTGGSETINLGNYYTREDIDTQQQQQNDSLAAITEKQTSQENKIIEVEKTLENLEVAGVDVASADKLGGIKAETKTDAETAEAKIDPETGKLYVPAGGNNPDNEDLFLEKDENTQKEVMKFADKEYNAAGFSGLGRVYLRKNLVESKNVLTEEMINDANTRYIIQYDYDLGGATINVPNGSVLDFQGGSLVNGTLTFNNTLISGVGYIECNVGGTVKGRIDLDFFGIKESDYTFDNGAIFNRVSSSLNGDLYLKPGKYYFKTPIIIEGRRNINFEGDLYYLGGINTTSLTVKKGYSSLICINKVSNEENENVSFSNFGEDTYMIGLDIQDCNNCTVYAKYIANFNENLRISGMSSVGCSYNMIRFDLLFKANIGLRIYQDNGGWANENVFLGGRIAILSYWETEGIDAVAIKIAGSGAASDTYNKVNSLLFIKISTEFFRHTGYTIFAKNVTSSSFIEGRNENSNTYIKWVGLCNRNNVTLGYLRNPTYDFTECTGYPLLWNNIENHLIAEIKWNNFISWYGPNSENPVGTCYQDYAVGFVQNNSSVTDLAISTYANIVDIASGFTNYIPAIRIDSSVVKTFYIRVFGDGIRWQIAYIKDKDGNVLTNQDQANYQTPISTLYRYGLSYTRGFRNGIEESSSFFMVPDNISQIEISFENKFEKIQVYGKEGKASLISIAPSNKGEYTPNYGYIGEFFFNTKLKKPYWCAGQKWVDATGTEA